MIETHFYSRDDEVISTARYENGEISFGGLHPRMAERITAELTVPTMNGPLAFKDAPVAWLRRVPYEMRTPYAGAIVAVDDEPADDPSLNAPRPPVRKPQTPAPHEPAGGAIRPGMPVLVQATSKSKGGKPFWQRGMAAVTAPLTDDDGKRVVWVGWLIEYEHARAEGRAPRARKWPAGSVRPDPDPPAERLYTPEA